MIDQGEFAAILEKLCPMHVFLDSTGHIRRVGPTLQKLRPDGPMRGARFLELFELNRPRAVSDMVGLLASSGDKLHLQFREAPFTSFKGLIVPMSGENGALVNLSFGISVLDGVREHALTSADFAATDLTIELLYLVEAKSAAMEASRKLNLRLQSAMIAAEEKAYTDPLTGLKNRRAIEHIMDRMISCATPFAMMHLDLDYFKSVNDTLGHAAGDHVLKQAVGIMIEETRNDDVVGRVGGDEFVLIFDNLQDRQHLESVANRLITRLQQPIPFEGRNCNISASIGSVLSIQSDQQDSAELMNMADLALYASKRAGRSCHHFYNPGLEGLSEEVARLQQETLPESDLIEAVATDSTV